MPSLTTIQTICGSILLLAILAGLFALVWHGSITGAAALAVVATIAAAAIGALAHSNGVTAGAEAARRQPEAKQ